MNFTDRSGAIQIIKDLVLAWMQTPSGPDKLLIKSRPFPDTPGSGQQLTSIELVAESDSIISLPLPGVPTAAQNTILAETETWLNGEFDNASGISLTIDKTLAGVLSTVYVQPIGKVGLIE